MLFADCTWRKLADNMYRLDSEEPVAFHHSLPSRLSFSLSLLPCAFIIVSRAALSLTCAYVPLCVCLSQCDMCNKCAQRLSLTIPLIAISESRFLKRKAFVNTPCTTSLFDRNMKYSNITLRFFSFQTAWRKTPRWGAKWANHFESRMRVWFLFVY